MTTRRNSLFIAVLSLGLATTTLRADLTKVVPEGAKVRKVAGDCIFTEGPAWSPEGYLLFSDIPSSRIVKIDADGKVSDFLEPSGRANGLAFNAEGELFACQGAGDGGEMRIAKIDPKTKKQTALADKYEGKRLNSPNDLALDAHGGIYFTDPRYGGQQPAEQPVMGVYYRDADGKVTRIIDDLVRPNGILVSPNGKLLYVAEPNKRELYRYDISAPWKISGKKRIYTGAPENGGGPDGMAHDVHGNVYATYKDVVVLDPDGKELGIIPVPERTSNCTFGGKDGKTLFITARKSVYAIDLAVKGAAHAGRGRGITKLSGTKLREEKIGVLAMKVPASWKRGQPRSRMRKGQFEVAAVKGDKEAAELVIFYFGRNQGGGVVANVQRWVGQFDAKDRKVRVLVGKAPSGSYTIVDATGTYNKPIGPPIAGKNKPTPGQRMLAVILPTSEGTYFLKFTGPKATVTANAEVFRTSFGGDRSKEREQL